jgi:hypothetical protein
MLHRAAWGGVRRVSGARCAAAPTAAAGLLRDCRGAPADVYSGNNTPRPCSTLPLHVILTAPTRVTGEIKHWAPPPLLPASTLHRYRTVRIHHTLQSASFGTNTHTAARCRCSSAPARSALCKRGPRGAIMLGINQGSNLARFTPRTTRMRRRMRSHKTINLPLPAQVAAPRGARHSHRRGGPGSPRSFIINSKGDQRNWGSWDAAAGEFAVLRVRPTTARPPTHSPTPARTPRLCCTLAGAQAVSPGAWRHAQRRSSSWQGEA